jgi:uncharacterized protein with von Willebrand factor type A (vWA) domain
VEPSDVIGSRTGASASSCRSAVRARFTTRYEASTGLRGGGWGVGTAHAQEAQAAEELRVVGDRESLGAAVGAFVTLVVSATAMAVFQKPAFYSYARMRLTFKWLIVRSARRCDEL